MLNSERLRTLTVLRRDEKKFQDRLQKNRWLLVSVICFVYGVQLCTVFYIEIRNYQVIKKFLNEHYI